MAFEATRKKGRREDLPSFTASSSTSSRYGEAALTRELIGIAQSIEDQNRNSTLNAAAFSLGQLIAGGELDQSSTEAALLGAAMAKGLGEKEARNTIRSGIAAGMREPRSAPERGRPTTTCSQDHQPPVVGSEKPQETHIITPDPLEVPDVMTGAAGSFAETLSSYLEPAKIFFYTAYLACLGNLAAGRLVLNSEIQAEPRLYVLILGESADDRKSTSISKTVSFFRSATEDFPVCHGVGSAEGLQKILMNSDRLLLCLDEFRAFTSKCKIESSVLMPAVTTLFESRYYESHTSKKSVVIENASLSILAASTVDTYEQIFDEHFLAIGFPNRIFLCPGKGRRRFSLPIRIPDHDWASLKRDLLDVLAHIEDLRTVEITYGARKLYHEWYMGLPQSVHAKRLETYAMRLMPLLAVNELKNCVDEEIASKVIQLMDWQYRVRRRYDPIDADNLMARTEEKIRRSLETGPKTRRELSRAVHASRIGTWFFETAVTNLTRGGQILTEDKGKTYRITEIEGVTNPVTTGL